MGRSKGNKISKAGKTGPQAETDSTVLLDTRSIVIPVMGPTGVGKSTFINAVLGREWMKIGKEIESCTVDIATADIGDLRSLFPGLQRYLSPLHERRVLLVDTPGFDDTYVDDSEILEKLANWLKDSYSTYSLGGVIYLHDISIDRYTGSTKKNLNMFRHLCGDAALDRVVLGITKAGRLQKHEAAKRLDRLKENHWKVMIEKRATVFSLEENRNSALNLVRGVLRDFATADPTHLDIQKELVIDGKIIPETSAAQELRLTLKQLLEHQKKYAQLSETATTADDPTAQADLKEAKLQIEKLQKQLQVLKVPFLRRVFGGLFR